MYTTKGGAKFDGTKWEEVCQVCFRLKYEIEGYQSMPATVKGDLGIEGFTRTGKVFQCYCPDSNSNNEKLYESQRDKITTDLNKITSNHSTLSHYLGTVKIKYWYFVTPEYTNKDLIKHCENKKCEIKSLNLPILDKDFDILILDMPFFAKELPTVLDYKKDKLLINPKNSNTEENYNDWKSESIDLVQNSIKKHRKRFSSDSNAIDDKVNLLTNKDVRNFLNGEYVLRDWNNMYPEQYERFLTIVSQIEENVAEQCLFYSDNYNEKYQEIQNSVKIQLKDYFSNLDDITINRLCDYVISDWILRCPIDFE